MNPDIRKNMPQEIAAQAAFLGVIFGIAITLLPLVKFINLPTYMAALAVFHFLEYWITAKYNPSKVSSDSFLINHSGAYTAAHAASFAEALFELYFFPQYKLRFAAAYWLGLVLMVAGQTLRTFAMKTAGESFSHIIAVRKLDQHKLVTSGVYAVSRHPSYAGYYWWAIGSQLLLVNPVCLVVFSVVLYRFFSKRIAYEERYLVTFYGEEYVQYRQQKPVYIPFIK